MNKSTLSAIGKQIQTSFVKHSPEILTGIGIAGMLVATGTAVRVTPKAIQLLDEKKKETEAEKLTLLETIRTAGFCYIPVVIISGLSVICLIGANTVHTKRHAALTAAYILSESASKEYRDKVLEVIGEKKEKTVRDAVAKEQIERHPVDEEAILITKSDGALCYDVLSGRYFYSNIDTLQKAANELNRQMLEDTNITLNDFYYEIGLSSTRMGDDLGWDIEDGLLDLQFSAQLTEKGKPCLVLDYRNPPRYDYCRR